MSYPNGVRRKSQVKMIEHHRPFVVLWDKAFRFLSLWLCLYPGMIIFGYDLYYWLQFARFLDLDTYKILPPRLLGFLYNMSHWEGVNAAIYALLQLPIFVTLPVFNFLIVFILMQSILAIYYFIFDTRAVLMRMVNFLLSLRLLMRRVFRRSTTR